MEEWKPIEGFEGRYWVSNLGRVKGIYKCLRQAPTRNGYLYVELIEGYQLGVRVRKWKVVHNLVTAAFIGPKPKGLQVNHIDGVKTHNERTNLEYVTPSENMLHAVRHKLLFPLSGETHPMAKVTDAQRIEMVELFKAGKFNQRELGIMFGLTGGAVRHSIIKAGYPLPTHNPTHCPHGHEYNDANTYRWKRERHCRICRVRSVKLARLKARSLSYDH